MCFWRRTYYYSTCMSVLSEIWILLRLLPASENFWKGKHTTRVKYLYSHASWCVSHCSCTPLRRERGFLSILQVRIAFSSRIALGQSNCSKSGRFPQAVNFVVSTCSWKEEKNNLGATPFIGKPQRGGEMHAWLPTSTHASQNYRPQTPKLFLFTSLLSSLWVSMGNNSSIAWW